MTSTRSAVTGLPQPPHVLVDPLPRRGFLRGLANLPLIGGSVALFGQPTAVAEPVTFDMLQPYETWLNFEHRYLAWEMADLPRMVAWYGGTRAERSKAIGSVISFVNVGEADRWHRDREGKSPPSTRAALVMSTVGCDWKET